jgi:hypothetical protein
MTKVRPTGFSLPAFGLQWEFVQSDKDVARTAVIYLEDRRVLFGDRDMEDGYYCLMSALEIRQRLTGLIPTASPGGGVEQSLRAIRAACTRFANRAGPEANNFRSFNDVGTNQFGLALGELRSLVGIQVALLVGQFDLEVEEDLLSIFPPPDQDLSWLPGFKSEP